MNKDQTNRLAFIFTSLKEFSYCLDRLNNVSDTCKPGSAMMRFYLNSIYSYVANYLLLSKKENEVLGGNLYPALKDLGLEHLLDPIIEALKEEIDNIEFREIILKFRNKVFVHTDFTFNQFDKHIYSKIDFTEKKIFDKYQELLQKLCYQIQELYIKIGTILLSIDSTGLTNV